MALVDRYDHIVASITSKPPAEDAPIKIEDYESYCNGSLPEIMTSSLICINDDDREAEVFRCLSCFSFFIPTGNWFKLFWIFGGKNDNKDVQNQPPLSPTTTTKTMAVEQGTEYTYEYSASQYMVSEPALLEANPGDQVLDVREKSFDAQNSLTTVTKHHHEDNMKTERLSNLSPSTKHGEAQETNFKPSNNGMIESDEVFPLEEAAPELIEYDVERVLKKQDTHDLYCPNCNSCITRRVILRKRKRIIKESDQKPKPTADPMLDTISEELSHSSIPTGNGFKLFRIFGGKNDNKDVQNQPPVSATTTKTMAVEQGMIESEEVFPVEEAAPKLIEYDVESVLRKQDTHDLYCPNCNSCITRMVILRKRRIKESNQKSITDKRDHIVASITSKPPAEDATA